jgi:hypothetical protein
MVTAGHEMLGNAEGAVGHPVDVGRERLGHDRDPTFTKVNYELSP